VLSCSSDSSKFTKQYLDTLGSHLAIVRLPSHTKARLTNRTKRLRNYLHLHHHHSHSKERTPLLTSTLNSRPSHIRFDSSSNPIPDTQEIPANRIPLLLDPEQVTMIHNLNQLPLERVITFWPWCWNTHAMLVVRSVFLSLLHVWCRARLMIRAAKRFKYQEEGRKVVRNWAEWILEVGEGVAHTQ
jgi:hypothetical protein